MANYEKHSDDENKFQCPDCDYGHGEGNGKSRQGVSMHFKKKHVSQEIEESPVLPLLEDDILPNVSDEAPEWLNFDMSPEENDEATVSISPLASTLLRGMVSEEVVPKTAQALREYYKQQGKMMRWIFSGFVDPIFKWWGRSITSDETFDIKRTSSDWELFEDASTAWLEYHSMSIPVTPDMVMLGTVGTFYVPVIASIHKKRDPSRLSLFARWKTRRALKRALKKEGVETQ
jgi:hypothetical protein